MESQNGLYFTMAYGILNTKTLELQWARAGHPLPMRLRKNGAAEDLEDLEGLNFDLIVTLSPEAHHKALELTRTLAVDVEYWPTADPTAIEGSREQRLEAYREVRDQLLRRIRERFSPLRRANE